jgi:ribonuclease P/MRP protein subunit POP1
MAHATVYEDQTFPYGLIGPVDILWRPEEQHLEDRTVWLRIHPSIYQPTMDLLRGLISLGNDEASSSSKVHQPFIVMNDLRGEVDSFEVMGPKSARILRRILRLSKTEGKDKQKVSPRVVRFRLWLICSSSKAYGACMDWKFPTVSWRDCWSMILD